MSYKFSLAHLTVLGWSPVEMAYNASLIGYDYISIRNINMGVKGERDFSIPIGSPRYCALKEALDDTGIKIYDIELARVVDGVDVMSYESAFESGASLGAAGIISSIWTDKKDYYMEQFAKLCDLAAKYNLFVNLEWPSWADVGTLAQVREVIDTVKRPNAGVMLDTLHASRAYTTMEEIEAIPREQIKMAHICDGPSEIPDPADKEALIFTGRDARYYPGDGGIDIAGMLKRLPGDIVLSLELPHLERVAKYGYMEHARRCLVKSKKYLAEKGLL
ncbi:MAG: sugar phosphate isomerase/epimerase [Synergistaceae bacterium]|nr:sugar phosphate isomerase/epimerase [Synergistaceae bacterium]